MGLVLVLHHENSTLLLRECYPFSQTANITTPGLQKKQKVRLNLLPFCSAGCPPTRPLLHKFCQLTHNLKKISTIWKKKLTTAVRKNSCQKIWKWSKNAARRCWPQFGVLFGKEMLISRASSPWSPSAFHSLQGLYHWWTKESRVHTTFHSERTIFYRQS